MGKTYKDSKYRKKGGLMTSKVHGDKRKCHRRCRCKNHRD
jgi:hypothetical protein